MSVVRYKQDRNGIPGTLTVRITSETQYGAVGAGGLGPASNPPGILNSDGWLRSSNGSSDYTMSGVRQGIDPTPPVHRLTVYQGSFPISSVEFLPYETEPGIIDVLVQAAVYNAPSVSTEDQGTLQAYTNQVQQFASKLEQMKSYFEYANPTLTSQLTTTLNNAQTLYNTLNVQLPQTVAITEAVRAQGESVTAALRSTIRNGSLLNKLVGQKRGDGPVPAGDNPYFYPTYADSPLSYKLVTHSVRIDLPSVSTPMKLIAYPILFSETTYPESIYRQKQFGTWINVQSVRDNTDTLLLSFDYYETGSNDVVANGQMTFTPAELSTIGFQKGQTTTQVQYTAIVREYRNEWAYISISMTSRIPYNRMNWYLAIHPTHPHTDPKRRVFEILHPALLLDTYEQLTPYTVYPDNELEIDFQPQASQNAISAANSANFWASAAQNATNNANISAQNAQQAASENSTASIQARQAADRANAAANETSQVRESAVVATNAASLAASNANSSAEMAFAASNINVLFMSGTTANPRSPTQAELTSFSEPLYGAKAGAPDGWQRVLWTPHTTGGSWTNFGPRLGSSGLTVEQYVNSTGTGVVRDSARLGGAAASSYARTDTPTTFTKNVSFPLIPTGRKVSEMSVSGLLLPRLPNPDTSITLDYQDELAMLPLIPGRTVAVSSPVGSISTGAIAHMFMDSDASLTFTTGSTAYPIVIEMDMSANPISAASNGGYRPALTFRGSEVPTGIRVENWDGTDYQIVQDAVGLTASDFYGGFWLGNRFSSVASVQSGIRKLRITLTGNNPIASILYIQRVILYHATADYDPWRLHRKGGQMLGDVDFVNNSSPKVGGTTLPERTFLRSQTGGTVGRIVRRNGSNNWVNANTTDTADQLSMLGVRIGPDQVVIAGLVGGFTGLSVGAPVYLLDNGAVSSVRPGSGTVKIVGFAHTANDIQLASYTDTSDKASLYSPVFEGTAGVRGNFDIGGFDLTLGSGDQVARGNTGTSRALVKEASMLKINYAGDFTGGTSIGGTTTTVEGFELRLGSGDQTSRGNSGLSRALTKQGGNKLTMNINGDFAGGVELQGTAGLKVIGPVSGAEPTIASHLATKNYVDSKSGSTVPRGTGGSAGYLVTRKGSTANFQNLLPTSPLSDYRPGRVAVMGEFGPIYPGQTGRVNGLPFIGGRTYYGGPEGQLSPIPDPRPEDWPTLDLLNVNRLYYEAGVAYTDNGSTYFIHEASALVRFSDKVIGGEKADLQTIPLAPTGAVGNGLSEYVNFNGQSGLIALRTDDDPAVVQTLPVSPVKRTVGGVLKGVSLVEQNYGTDRLRYVTGQPQRLGGDLLVRFATISNDWNSGLPGVFFGGTGTLQNGLCYEIILMGKSTTTMSVYLRKVTFSGGVVTAEPAFGSGTAQVPRLPNNWYKLRVRVDAATKKVYFRIWNDIDPEPTTWTIDGIVATDLVAGNSGTRSKDGQMKWSLISSTPNGVVANE